MGRNPGIGPLLLAGQQVVSAACIILTLCRAAAHPVSASLAEAQ